MAIILIALIISGCKSGNMPKVTIPNTNINDNEFYLPIPIFVPNDPQVGVCIYSAAAMWLAYRLFYNRSPLINEMAKLYSDAESDIAPNSFFPLKIHERYPDNHRNTESGIQFWIRELLGRDVWYYKCPYSEAMDITYNNITSADQVREPSIFTVRGANLNNGPEHVFNHAVLVSGYVKDPFLSTPQKPVLTFITYNDPNGSFGSYRRTYPFYTHRVPITLWQGYASNISSASFDGFDPGYSLGYFRDPVGKNATPSTFPTDLGVYD